MPSQSIQFRLQFGKECYLFTDVPVVPSSCSFWYLAHNHLGLLVFGNVSKVYTVWIFTVCLSQHTLTSVQLHILTEFFSLHSHTLYNCGIIRELYSKYYRYKYFCKNLSWFSDSSNKYYSISSISLLYIVHCSSFGSLLRPGFNQFRTVCGITIFTDSTVYLKRQPWFIIHLKDPSLRLSLRIVYISSFPYFLYYMNYSWLK